VGKSSLNFLEDLLLECSLTIVASGVNKQGPVRYTKLRFILRTSATTEVAAKSRTDELKKQTNKHAEYEHTNLLVIELYSLDSDWESNDRRRTVLQVT
jgi:hypothetical protein